MVLIPLLFALWGLATMAFSMWEYDSGLADLDILESVYLLLLLSASCWYVVSAHMAALFGWRAVKRFLLFQGAAGLFLVVTLASFGVLHFETSAVLLHSNLIALGQLVHVILTFVAVPAVFDRCRLWRSKS